MVKSRKIGIGILVTGIVAAIGYWIYSLLSKKIITPSTTQSLAASTGGVSYVSTYSSSSFLKTKSIEFEVGDTEFTVTGFIPDATLSNFDLLLNNNELVNAQVDEENADFDIEHLGNGTFKITFISQTITLDPESHTLILKLR